MVERKVTVNPRASAVVITNSPKHIAVNREGIENLKNEVTSWTVNNWQQIVIGF